MAAIELGRRRSSWKENSNPRQCGASRLDSLGEDVEENEAELVVVLDLLGSASGGGDAAAELSVHGGSVGSKKKRGKGKKYLGSG